MRSKELIPLMDSPASIYEDALPELKLLLEEFPYFQTARLLYLKALSNIKDSSYTSELKKTAFYAGDRKRLFYLLAGEQMEKIRAALSQDKHPAENESFELIDIFLKNIGDISDMPDYLSNLSAYTLKEAKEEKEETPPLQHEDIIDQFLDEDKKHPIRPNMENHSDFSAENKSIADELPENSLTFSETLAKIYTKQQKYDKALEIIRKLSLLYPEKSVYFADQIQKLEKLIINAN